jgi:transcriptional regulator with XRE-family HTH domain
MSSDGPSGAEPVIPEPRAGPGVLRLLLGAQLRRLREAAEITPEQAGYEIRASRSKISRMEHGRVGFKERDVADLLTLYGVTDERTYARAVTVLGHRAAPADEIDRRVSLRMKRQDLLEDHDAPRVWSVMDEAALRRPVGGRHVMREQLNRLIEVAALPRVTVQVVPFRRGGHAGAGGSFTVLRFEQPDLPDVAYIEQLTSALYLEGRADVDHYLEVMNRLSAEALTPVGTVRFLKEIIRDT